MQQFENGLAVELNTFFYDRFSVECLLLSKKKRSLKAP